MGSQPLFPSLSNPIRSILSFFFSSYVDDCVTILFAMYVKFHFMHVSFSLYVYLFYLYVCFMTEVKTNMTSFEESVQWRKSVPRSGGMIAIWR